MADHLVEEVRRVEPLALQPSLHVDHGEYDRVEATVLDGQPQRLQREHRAPFR